MLPRSGDGAAVLVPLLVLGLPVLDALLVIRDRYREHPGRRWRLRMRRVFQADRRHLHHLLSTVGGQRSVVLALCGFVVLFCGLALFAASRGDARLGAGALAVQTVLLVLGRRVLARAPLAGGRPVRRTPRFAGGNLFTVRRQAPQ